MLGTAVAANITLVRGYHHERWRTDPERRFAFCPGGGIIFDMGCYYLMGLINILGPVRRVCGFSQIRGADDRRYMNPKNPEYGRIMPIETTNNIAGTLEFECGVICNILNSSESIGFNNYMLFCTDGQMNLGDPNNYGRRPGCLDEGFFRRHDAADSRVHRQRRGLWIRVTSPTRYGTAGAECSAERAYHMFEIAHGIMISGETGEIYRMKSPAARPEPFKAGYTEYPEMVMDI